MSHQPCLSLLLVLSTEQASPAFTTKLLAMRGETNHHNVVEEVKEVGNEMHTTMHKNKDNSSSTLKEGEMGLFSAGEHHQKVRYQWGDNAGCFRCGQKGHKVFNFKGNAKSGLTDYGRGGCGGRGG